MDLSEQLINAAEAGDEALVRRLLAAGARADQGDRNGWLPLHWACRNGHEGVVRLLLAAAPAPALALDVLHYTALHLAAANHVEVAKLLLAAAPASATLFTQGNLLPIHLAAMRSNGAAVELLLEAASEVAYAASGIGETPLHCVLRNRYQLSAKQVKEAARCLVRAAPAVQPTLGNLVQYSQLSAALFADLVSRLPLSQEQWQSIPAPCPDLARALPAVLQRSAAKAGWLVGRLGEGQRARLQAAALSLARAQHQCSAVLPSELNGRILALCLLGP